MLKNKPLIIGAIAVIALLIAGGIYFFVIKDNDSAVDTDTNTQDNGQEENGTDTDPGPSTEDDGSAA